MADAIRFYLDQHMSPAIAQGLRQRGIDVLTAQEAGRCGLADPDHLALAALEGRVIVTFDTDYLAMHRTGVAHVGIAWSPANKNTISQLIQALILIHGVLDSDGMRNHVEYL